MKLFIIAGEASGDLHGSNLIKELYEQRSDLEIQCWGGDLMEGAGAKVMKHYKELAFMGFWEVLKNIRTISRNFKLCKAQIEEFKPDAVIFIDYPGFNLRMAKSVKEQNIPTLYYISPQVWAWKQSRVKKIKELIDRMFVILPFEKAFYQKFEYDVEYVGHPLVDAISNFQSEALDRVTFCRRQNLDEGKKIIAILPGSRKQEIKAKLPIMLDVVKKYDSNLYEFIIAGAPSQDAEFYQGFNLSDNVKLIHGATYNILNNAHAAMVTSGTATLETALFKVPQVVCYKAGEVSYQIAKRLVKIDYISLVNLIMDQEVVRELIQKELNPVQLKEELDKMIEGEERKKVLSLYDELEIKLGGGGASEKTAILMLKTLETIS